MRHANKPAAMSSCERIDTLELAVIRRAKVQLWMQSGEVIEGRALALETTGGADWLTLDQRVVDAASVYSLRLL